MARTVYLVRACRRRGSRSRTFTRRSTAADIRPRRPWETGCASRPRSSATATTCSAQPSATGRRERGAGASRRSSRSATTAGKESSRRTRSGVSSFVCTRGSTRTRPGSTSSTARLRPASRISRVSCRRGRRCSARARWRSGGSGPARCRRRSVPESVKGPALGVDVERERARFGAWYELFPRSWGGFRGVAAVLPQLAELGFDVVYLPPVHPIGQTNRKGRNNAPRARKTDPGSPWAIGSQAGGHDAVHPVLGTEGDFDAMVEAAREAGVEIALDFAIQCSPDHPWLSQHPEWFQRRPDGSIKTRGEPAQALRRHPQRRLDDRRPGRAVARACATSCCTGASAASASSASTTRTRSRCRSGNG